MNFIKDDMFERYYQEEYDFNTSSLSDDDLEDIKVLVDEKRVRYALAPIGTNIFDFILEQVPEISFEPVKFDNNRIDGMLYIPKKGEKKAFIIINSNKPFINQIFTAAHEYYHYIRDYAIIKESPYVCSLDSLKNVNEKKASRFAAELLLPANALTNEIKSFLRIYNLKSYKKLSFIDYVPLCVFLTIKYQLPLKAVIFRLVEEKHILEKDVKYYIKNYSLIKEFLLQLSLFKEEIELLYTPNNDKIDNKAVIYKQIETVYKNGLASREEILSDADKLNLDKDIIETFFDSIDEADEDEDDSDIILALKQKWGE